MSLATREQSFIRLENSVPGALVLSRDERTIKKDLIKNTSERLRLRTKGEQSKDYRVKRTDER